MFFSHNKPAPVSLNQPINHLANRPFICYSAGSWSLNVLQWSVEKRSRPTRLCVCFGVDCLCPGISLRGSGDGVWTDREKSVSEPGLGDGWNHARGTRCSKHTESITHLTSHHLQPTAPRAVVFVYAFFRTHSCSRESAGPAASARRAPGIQILCAHKSCTPTAARQPAGAVTWCGWYI